MRIKQKKPFLFLIAIKDSWLFKARINKLWPSSQIQPNVCFSMVYEVRMALCFKNVFKNKNVQPRPYVARSLSYLLSGPLQKDFANSWSKAKIGAGFVYHYVKQKWEKQHKGCKRRIENILLKALCTTHETVIYLKINSGACIYVYMSLQMLKKHK